MRIRFCLTIVMFGLVFLLFHQPVFPQGNKPSDHFFKNGINSGWCYPLLDTCDDQGVCYKPVSNVSLGFMSFNSAAYPYNLAQDFTYHYQYDDPVYAMADGLIIKIRNSDEYGGPRGANNEARTDAYNTMVVKYEYVGSDGAVHPVYVFYGHVKSIKNVPDVSVAPRTEADAAIPVRKYEQIAQLNDPGASWGHISHLHLSVMQDALPNDPGTNNFYYNGYNDAQDPRGRSRPFDCWNNQKAGWIWSADWVANNGTQRADKKDQAFFDSFRPKGNSVPRRMNFENGVDGDPIRSTIPGLTFTTTSGFDWIYGDWRTGQYSGPYPNGPYFSNGHGFAWLGALQGTGRIDFTGATGTSLSLGASSQSGLALDAYDINDNLLGSSGWAASNLNTGQLNRLSVSGDKIAYVLVHDTGNYWVVDDLEVTDVLSDCLVRLPVDYSVEREEVRRIDPSHDDSSEFYNSLRKSLRCVLGWGGSELAISIYRPNGTLYGRYQSRISPITVDIRDAEPGMWSIKVAGIDVPAPGYPYALVIGSPESQKATALFPQFADGGGYVSNFLLSNPTDVDTTTTLTFVSSAGNLQEVTIDGVTASTHQVLVKARGSAKLKTSGLPVSAVVGWVSVTTNPAVDLNVNEVFQLFSGGVLVCEAAVPGVSAVSNIDFFADEELGYKTGFALANPGSSTASGVLTLRMRDGRVFGTYPINLDPGNHAAVFLYQLFGNDAPSGRAEIQMSSGYVAATALRYHTSAIFSTVAVGTAGFAPSAVSALFSPNGGVRDRLLEEIGNAQSTIDIAMYSLTDDIIRDALVIARARGVVVRIIADTTRAGDPASDVNALEQAGCLIRLKSGLTGGVMNHKFMIVDGRLLVTGSYDWSEGAQTSNYENALFVTGSTVVQKYKDEFERLWAQIQ